ncbi:MAG TPA: xylulokinase [Anaeromyxobacteraceae bacterium]|nr:xylulokinase [Anaeromyxobacteraceae bacterium]
MDALLGIDVGTTALKVSLFLEDGRLLGSAGGHYPILSPAAGRAEQDPEAWWRALLDGCAALKAAHPTAFSRLAGIGICGQMHTQVYLDRAGTVLRPAITWMDQRASAIVLELEARREGRDLIFAESQNFATTTYTAPQVLWVKREEPALFARVSHILLAKDYLKYRLTGRLSTDPSDATGTLLFNVVRGTWSEALLRYFDLSPTLFPEVWPSATIAGRVTGRAAAESGLKEGTPVANGSSDNSASALGAGIVRPGQAALISGTAGVITVCSERPLPDPARRTLCWSYCLPGRFIALGIMQTAGESLNWFRRAFDPEAAPGQLEEEVFREYDRLAESVPEGSEGLVFLPYLCGERTPHWDPLARGLFFGVGLQTKKAHFVRAVMEGVAMGFRQNVEAVESLGVRLGEIRAVGGGMRSPVWLSILARIVRRPIATVLAPDPGNLGNVLLCGKALGLYDSLEAQAARLAGAGTALHFPEGSAAYERTYRLYAALYPVLRATYRSARE